MAERSKAPESGNYLSSESFLIWSFVARVRIPLPSISYSVLVVPHTFVSIAMGRVEFHPYIFLSKEKTSPHRVYSMQSASNSHQR